MTDFRPASCRSAVDRLSERERAVLRLMSEGLATKQMAVTLEIGEGTVRVYRERIFSKLGVNSLGPAVRVGTLGGV